MPVTELEHLDEELDVDEPPAPGLEGDRIVVRGATLLGDAGAHARDLRHFVRGEAPSVDEAGDDGLQLLAQRDGSAQHPRLDERLAFPELGAPLVVVAERVERGDERTLVARGPEPRVDVVGDPFPRRGLQEAHGALRDPGEVFVRDRAPAPESAWSPDRSAPRRRTSGRIAGARLGPAAALRNPRNAP